jgi:hypothetical protein
MAELKVRMSLGNWRQKRGIGVWVEWVERVEQVVDVTAHELRLQSSHFA